MRCNSLVQLSFNLFFMPLLLKKRSFRDFFLTFLLGFFSIYLFLGNFTRLIRTELFDNNLSLSEILLYLICFCAYPYTSKLKSKNFSLLLLSLSILASNLWGIMLHGFDLKSFIYSIRLIAMIFSATVLGKIAFLRYGNDLISFFHFFLKTYAMTTLLGFLIFFTFISSEGLWVFLKKFHIVFWGDPHIKRFVSPYFDPNFYSAIACIPLLQSLLLRQYTKKNNYYFLSFFFLLSILLSWSRSGIATLAFLSCCILFSFLKSSQFFKIYPSHFGYTIFSLGLLMLLPFFFMDQISFFLDRFLHMNSDDSALGRLFSFQLGWDLFREHPLFGVGYNYLSIFSTQYSSVDSSLLSTLVYFGLIPFLTAFLLFFFWSYNHFHAINAIKKENPFLHRSFRLFYCYLCIIVFFSCHFNNLLYYQFWLIPMISIFSYFSQSIQSLTSLRNCPRRNTLNEV